MGILRQAFFQSQLKQLLSLWAVIKNRYASLIRPIKFRTSDSLHDAAMERFG